MKIKQFFATLCALCLCCTVSAGIVPDKVMPPHPRLLLMQGEEQDMMQFVNNDTLWSLFQGRTIAACDRLLACEPLQKKLEGRRMLSVSREGLYRVFMLSYAYRSTGERKYADRAEKEMLAYAAFDSWNPTHFLDVAEMTMALSIGYDWLYNELSPRSRATIRKAILNKGLRTSMDKRYNSFLQKTNNWCQVCNTAMAYASIALMDTDRKLCTEILERSIEKVRTPMQAYGPDGAYPEGYGYWHYGTTYNVMLLAALETLYGSDFGLSAIPGFVKGGEYVLNMLGPTERAFNFGDSGETMRLNTSLYWFARRTGNASLLHNELRYLTQLDNFDYEQYHRMLPSIFVLGRNIDLVNLPQPEHKLFAACNETPVCLMRSGWDNEAIYVGVKGGSPSYSTHTHLDGGTFVMDAQGVRWAIDLGPQEYNTLESKGVDLWNNKPDGQRWEVYRYNNLAHNVFTINDTPFRTEGRATLLSWNESESLQECIFDLTPLYNGIHRATRRVALEGNKQVRIEDRVSNGANAANLTWRMLTEAKVEIVPEGFKLSQDGKTLHVYLPHGVKAFTAPAQPKHDYDQPNPGVTVIGYRTTLPEKSARTLTVTLVPQQNSDKAYIREVADRVARWQITHQPEVKHPDTDWTNAAWYRGLTEWAKLTDNERYFDFLKAQAAKNEWRPFWRLYHPDDICVSQTYIELYRRYGNKEWLTHTVQRADSVIDYPTDAIMMKTDPRGKLERWSWSDALFMAPPVYAALSQLTGNSKYADFMQKEFEECTDSLYDAAEGLYYRDCSKRVLREPNGAKQFWGRGNGWVEAAFPLILENLPEGYAKRDYYVRLFREMSARLIREQDAEGSWHASLLDAVTYPQPENSASAFICYGLAWGIRNGLLEPDIYKPAVLKAWNALCRYVHPDGKVGYIQPVGNAPVKADYHSTDVYGVGAFLLAASEMYRGEW